MLNVAVSRAKEVFVVVGSTEKMRNSGGYLAKIYKHCLNKGHIIPAADIDDREPVLYKKIKNQVSDKKILTTLEHLQVFEDTLSEAKNEVVIVSPWVRHKNIANYSINYIQKALSSR